MLLAPSLKSVCLLSSFIGSVQRQNLLLQQFQLLESKAGTQFLRRAGGHKAGSHHGGLSFDPKVRAVLVHVHVTDVPTKHQGQVMNHGEDPPWWCNAPLPSPAVTHVLSQAGAHRGLVGAGK